MPPSQSSILPASGSHVQAAKRRVVVTGVGVVSPFGRGVETYWRSLLRGEHAWGNIRRFSADSYRSALGAEVPAAVYEDRAARGACGDPPEDSTYYLILAAEEALEGARMGPVFADEDRVGCVLGTLCASSDNMMRKGKHYLTGSDPDGIPPRASLVHFQLDYLCERYNLTGPSSLVSTACASSTDALGFAADLIRSGECEVALSGGGDILSQMIHGGFNSLFSISQTAPKPFDTARDGFVIGEGAGVVFLETLDSARERGATIYAEVLGYGLSNTAFHLTATSVDGSGEALAISRALADAGIGAGRIDYINLHGTGTIYNDATEKQAIAHVFGEHAGSILANSIKPAIGHCMGASGIMEAIATILALRDGIVPPTLFTSGDEPDVGVRLVTGECVRKELHYAISQSFGFGGACSCVVFGRAPEATVAQDV